MRIPEADHTFRLCQELGAANLEVKLLTTRQERPAAADGFSLDASVERWTWPSLAQMRKVIRAFRPDSILLFYLGTLYDFHPAITFAPSLAKRIKPGVRFVTQFSNPIGSSPADQMQKLMLRLARLLLGYRTSSDKFGTLLRDSDRLIVFGGGHKKKLLTRGQLQEDQVDVIPPPPLIKMAAETLSVARSTGRKMLGIRESVMVLCYFGRIYPAKGVETLLEAFKIIHQRHPGTQLVLIGGAAATSAMHNDNYADGLKSLAENLGLQKTIRWTGEFAWDGCDASYYLHASDICVLPFDKGVMLNNSSLAAAVTHRLPIVTTTGDFTDECFREKESLMLCPPKNPLALAQAVCRILEDPGLRKQLADASGFLANRFFSWEQAIQATLRAVIPVSNSIKE